VKSIWFHLMPYPDLPDDFTERQRSVWVDIDPALFDPHVAHHAYNDYIDELEHAARLGFDGVGVNEHHANAYGLMPSPNIVAAALARTCPDAAIVLLGDSVALYNPPLRVAEELAMLDCITGGRVVAGFPVGTPMDTVFAYGQNPLTLRERYHEAVELIRRAWTEPGVFTFNGRFNKLRYVNCWPRPVQRPHPPVWIPGGGSIDTWEWCAREGHVYLYLSYFGYRAGEATMRGFWDRVRDAGREPNPYQAGFAQFFAVADTEREARALYREPAEYFFHRCLHVYPGFADPPGYKTPNTVRVGVEGMVERAAREAAARAARAARAAGAQAGSFFGKPGLTFDDMIDRGYIILGDPDQVAERMVEVATSLNVGHIMTLCQFGNMSRELTMHITELMATKVLPQVRCLFDDQWEDHWWPRPMAPAERARSTTGR
jgi:alkanesulfonate monooxygenase SsuD/methylene tetrahydromethanopterin reductase-like flavin-dependent oxidoreductase (luciferase family)